MQLKYRGCSYDSKSTNTQAAPSNATLIYLGVKYQQNATTPQLAAPQPRSMMYRGSIYFTC
jgi:Domain of unknown function (DUF4278)